MLDYSWFTVLVGSLGNLIIGLATYFRASKSATSKWFATFTVLLALYLVFNQFSVSSQTVSDTLFWIRSVMVVSPFIVFSFFVLVNVFPNDQMTISKKVFVPSLVCTLAVSILGFTPLIFQSVEINPIIQPNPGKLIFAYVLYNLVFVLWSFIILAKKWKKSSGIERNQLKFLVLGAIIMFSLILVSNVFLVVVFGVSNFVSLVPVYTLIFVGMASYAIVQLGLFDVKIIATEATTLILWLVLFAKLFITQDVREISIDAFVLIVVTIFSFILVRSVTREVKQREELQELTEKLQALDKQKDEFISMAAHELRAPMTAIRGYVSMLLDGDAGELPDTARDYLTDANTVTERLVRLVNNMLNVGRIEEGRMVFKEEVVKVSEVVNHVYISFKFEAQRKNLDFGVNIQEGVKDTVYVDVDKLNEVIGNLVSNSIKYTERGRIDINIKQSNSEWIRVEIVDTGTGISQEEQKKLFQKFYRVESSVGKTIGTGLGLYICRLLIDKFGGKIGLDSTPGKGSNFWFELPVVDKDYSGPKSVEQNKGSVNIKV